MSKTHALIVDDEPDIRELLRISLLQMGIEAELAGDLASARDLLATKKFNFALVDMRLPDGEGIELVREISTDIPNTPVAVITAHGNMEMAVETMKAGAFDFVSKPIQVDKLRTLVSNAISLNDKRKWPAKIDKSHRLIGNSKVMSDIRHLIEKISLSQAPVHITGETGTGKELAARSIHERGPRAEMPFIPVNCGAIPGELMESEFFGHAKGSFTGAHKEKPGLFHEANGGTLFLDEVADLPLGMQVKLLRAIQEKSIRPVGQIKEQMIDVRIISASHKNLQELVEQGSFRQDLFYRINVIELRMPSLREHPEDLLELTNHLLSNRFDSSADLKLSTDAISKLQQYDYPGNIRELENILERASALRKDSIITPSDITLPQQSSHELEEVQSKMNLGTHLVDIEKERILHALDSTRWNRTAAAKLLGISLRQLRYKLEKFSIK